MIGPLLHHVTHGLAPPTLASALHRAKCRRRSWKCSLFPGPGSIWAPARVGRTVETTTHPYLIAGCGSEPRKPFAATPPFEAYLNRVTNLSQAGSQVYKNFWTCSQHLNHNDAIHNRVFGKVDNDHP